MSFLSAFLLLIFFDVSKIVNGEEIQVRKFDAKTRLSQKQLE